jgi:hypothetical protein
MASGSSQASSVIITLSLSAQVGSNGCCAQVQNELSTSGVPAHYLLNHLDMLLKYCNTHLDSRTIIAAMQNLDPHHVTIFSVSKISACPTLPCRANEDR